ncbi:MAG: phospholipase D family protein [Deltaproteobacteria bacterium]|nr:phospholipase D family protein [Deltaproteobacteria bacterium]
MMHANVPNGRPTNASQSAVQRSGRSNVSASRSMSRLLPGMALPRLHSTAGFTRSMNSVWRRWKPLRMLTRSYVGSEASMTSPLFTAAAALVPDAHYAHVLRGSIVGARERIWCTQFVVDGRPGVDTEGDVRYLCHALAGAQKRGVDVRCLLDDLVPTSKPYELNAAASAFLRARGVPVRVFQEKLELPGRVKRQRRRTLHSKIALFDESLALVGNHNWTPTAMRSSREMSIAVRGRDPIIWLAQHFDSLWNRGTEIP